MMWWPLNNRGVDDAKQSPVVCGGGEQGGELCGMLPVPYPL